MNPKILDRLLVVWLIGLFGFLILPDPVRVVFLGAFVITCILRKRGSKEVFKWGFFFANVLFYLMAVLSLTYSSDFQYGVKMCVRLLPLFLLPLGYAFLPRESILHIVSRQKVFTLVFCLSVLLVLGASIAQVFSHNMLLNPENVRAALYNFLGYASISALYLSFFCGLGILLLFNTIGQHQSSLIRILNAVLLTILVVMLLYLGFKSSILATGLVLTTLTVAKNHKRIWQVFALTIVVAAASYLMMDSLILETSLLHTGLNELSADEGYMIRKDIETCTDDVVKNHWLVGHGIGDGKESLNQCLADRNPLLSSINYNSHNQFVGIMSKLGLLGLLSFLLSLAYNANKATVHNQIFPISILMFFLVIMFTENILERQDGVLPYSLMITSFFISSAMKRNRGRRFQLTSKV